GLFGNWFKDVLLFLFMPSADVMGKQIQDTYQVIKDKFPFGYLTYIIDLVDVKMSEAEAQGTQTLPSYTMVFQGHNLPILDFQELKNNLPTFFDYFYSIIQVVIHSLAFRGRKKEEEKKEEIKS
ncbi:unnamed protein product, partial [marine sediment metagenome]